MIDISNVQTNMEPNPETVSELEAEAYFHNVEELSRRILDQCIELGMEFDDMLDEEELESDRATVEEAIGKLIRAVFP